MINRHNELLRQCYLTGHISEEAWQRLLNEDSAFAAYIRELGEDSPREFVWHPVWHRWYEIGVSRYGERLYYSASAAAIGPCDITSLLDPDTLIVETLRH